MILLLTFAVFSSESWTFDPQIHKVKIKTDQISFKEADSPQLYAEDTSVEFYTLVQNLINKAKREDRTLQLSFETHESAINGTYLKIIPQN